MDAGTWARGSGTGFLNGRGDLGAGQWDGFLNRSGTRARSGAGARRSGVCRGTHGRVQGRVERVTGRGGLVGRDLSTAQLAIVEVVVADHADGRRVNMDGDRSGLMIHPVHAVAGEPELLARAVLVRGRRRADRERLVPRAARDHVYADTRAIMVVVAGVARLPPQVEPSFGVRIVAEQD